MRCRVIVTRDSSSSSFHTSVLVAFYQEERKWSRARAKNIKGTSSAPSTTFGKRKLIIYKSQLCCLLLCSSSKGRKKTTACPVAGSLSFPQVRREERKTVKKEGACSVAWPTNGYPSWSFELKASLTSFPSSFSYPPYISCYRTSSKATRTDAQLHKELWANKGLLTSEDHRVAQS